MTEAAAVESLIAALDEAWQSLQARNPDLPQARVTLTEPAEQVTVLLGSDRDQPVIRFEFGGTALRNGALVAFNELLYHATHALASARGIGATSRGGRYHNALFRGLASELGAETHQYGHRGWADVRITDHTQTIYRRQIESLEEPVAVLASQPHQTKPAAQPSRVRAECACGYIIWAAPSTFTKSRPRCSYCGRRYR